MKYLAGIIAVLLLVAGVAYAQPGTKAAIAIESTTKIAQRVTALEAEVTAIKTALAATQNQLTAANTKITALEKEDKLKITRFLGIKNPDGTYPSAEVDIIDTDGSASGAVSKTSTIIPHGIGAAL